MWMRVKQSTSKTELPIASAGSHEPNTRVGRKRKRVQKKLKQSAISPLFSAEQQQFLSKLVTKMVQAEKSQVDVDGVQVQTQRVPAEQISRNQQQTSSKSKCRRLAQGEASTPEILEDKEDVERPTPQHTQTGMHRDQSHTLHSVYPVSEKWVKQILRSEFVDFDALLAECPSSILYAASAMADQSQVALEVGPAGLSIAQKHQRRLVTNITSWLTAWSLFANTLTVGNPSRASELFGYQLLIAQVASRFTTVAWLQCDRAFRKAASRKPARRWDEVDVSLWSICFTNQARMVCFKCRDSELLPSQCLKKRQQYFRSMGDDNSNQSGQLTSKGARIVTLANTNVRSVCRDYNSGTCNNVEEACKFAHTCSCCGGQHAALVCESKRQ